MVTANVTINPSPTASVTPANPAPECNGVPIILSANTGVGLTYQWYNFGNPIAGATNPTYQIPGNGHKKYKVEVTNSFGCTALSNVVDVNRLATPNANIQIVYPTDNPDLCVNINTKGWVKLRGNGSADVPLGYEWKKNGVTIPGATDRDYLATVPENYRVRVTNLTTGCSNLSPAVTVFDSCPAKEGSINELPQVVLHVYPNPTDGHFMLQLNLNDQVHGEALVQVFNKLGQSIFNETVPVTDGELLKEMQLHTKDAAGIYLVRIISRGRVYTSQLVYQH